MQLIIKSYVEKLELPINYKHILQSVIYNGLATDQDQKAFVHDAGWKYGNREFRFFQFSDLRGKYTVGGGKITFYNEVEWEVRSIDARLIQVLRDSIEKNGIRYLNTVVKNNSVEVRDFSVEATQLEIKMKTPICVYFTDPNTKKTYFPTPSDEDFYTLIIENFRKKYYAYSGNAIDDAISIEPIQVLERDKHVTKYKGFYLSGWTGRYILSGERKYLDFLYQVGIGAKNSQGFGMFDGVE